MGDHYELIKKIQADKSDHTPEEMKAGPVQKAKIVVGLVQVVASLNEVDARRNTTSRGRTEASLCTERRGQGGAALHGGVRHRPPLQVLDITWPENVKALLARLAFLNFDLFAFFRIDCITIDLGFRTWFVLMMAAPLALLGLGYGWYLWYMWRYSLDYYSEDDEVHKRAKWAFAQLLRGGLVRARVEDALKGRLSKHSVALNL